MIQYLFSNSLIGLLFKNPFFFAIFVIAILVVISIHEFAHAWAADRLGDPSARNAGRLTLNPLAHLDPIGTIMILFLGFGWGKPVPFDDFNLRNPRKDAALISFAGPAANFILAILLSIIIRVLYLTMGPDTSLIKNLEQILMPFINLAVLIGIFNLIPIHPLDGGKILIGLLPQKIAYQWDAVMKRYGFILILILIFPIFGFSLFSVIFLIRNAILALLLPGAPLI